MVFSMHVSANSPEQHQSGLIVLGMVLILSMFGYYLFTNKYPRSYGVEVKSVTLLLNNGNAILNADIDYQFSQTAITALDNGISLPLDVDVVVNSQREWLWDKTEWKTTLSYQIRYLALSKSYELMNESSGSLRSFSSRRAAINALGRIRGMPVAKSYCPSANQQCELLIRVTLNREGLPLPLRVVAYMSLDWYLSSGWKRWPLIN
jgi:hypothetical protein